MAITDHETMEAAFGLRRLRPLEVIAGQEISTEQGELIGLFLESPVIRGLPCEVAAAAIKAQGGLVYLEHPYDTSRRSMQEEAIERLAEVIDIVEVFNARSTQEANRKAEDLCAILDAAPGAGSDAHTLGEIGSVYIEMEAFSTPQDFVAKLHRGTIVRAPNRFRMRLGAALRRRTRRR